VKTRKDESSIAEVVKE